jgi:hypothetical protein
MNPIITISGDRATVDTHFVVYSTSSKPESGKGTVSPAGFYGSIVPVESGYYSHQMERVNGDWKLSKVTIVLDVDLKQA